MELVRLARVHPRSFRRMGSRYGPWIDREFFLSRDPFEDSKLAPHKRRVPPVNVRRDAGQVILEMAVPGYSRDEIHVSVVNDVLIIRGEDRDPLSTEADSMLREEFGKQRFERRFRMHEDSLTREIKAELKDGVLRLRMVASGMPVKVIAVE